VGGEPTGLALDDGDRTAFTWSQASRTVTSFPMDSYHPGPTSGEEPGLVRVVALGARVDEPDPVAKGRALFHTTGDSRISSDGRACASCHPDGRDDGLVWATPDGPRQTPTLAGRLAGTAPYGWNGARGTVKQHVTSTLKRLGGTGLESDDMDALIAYCMAMKAPPQAAAKAAQDVAMVEEGHDIFESSSAGCSSCHMPDGTFTDGNRHNVGSKAKGDPGRKFDTPSLRFVAGTAPYFHDGRYPTLRALLLGSDGGMGHTRQLSTHQIDALQAYLETL
jgi:cytochrome c peroxidase